MRMGCVIAICTPAQAALSAAEVARLGAGEAGQAVRPPHLVRAPILGEERDAHRRGLAGTVGVGCGEAGAQVGQAAVLSGSVASIGIEEYATDRKKFEAVLFKPRGWGWMRPSLTRPRSWSARMIWNQRSCWRRFTRRG